MDIKDLAGVGKTVKTVTDAVRGAVSVLYRPKAIIREGRARANVDAYRIETLARAEAKASLIKDQAIEQLAERARKRFVMEQIIQQQSIDSILEKAVKHSESHAKIRGRKISEHWLYRLMLNGKDITDDEIQDIFAKLIVEQGSAYKKPISYMTLDALRLFEPRHARYFEAFCKLFYVFDGPTIGIKENGQWIGEEEFNELNELGMIDYHPVPLTRLRFRDFTLELPTNSEYKFDSIFGSTPHLTLKGIELSRVLYPEISTWYWGKVKGSTDKRSYESAICKFLPPETQYESFKDILNVILDDSDSELVILVHQWSRPYGSKPIARFAGSWSTPFKPPVTYYVPPYIRRFLGEIIQSGSAKSKGARQGGGKRG